MLDPVLGQLMEVLEGAKHVIGKWGECDQFVLLLVLSMS